MNTINIDVTGATCLFYVTTENDKLVRVGKFSVPKKFTEDQILNRCLSKTGYKNKAIKDFIWVANIRGRWSCFAG